MIPYLFFYFNLIALKTAKTLWSFDHSECNRAKHSDKKVGENFFQRISLITVCTLKTVS